MTMQGLRKVVLVLSAVGLLLVLPLNKTYAVPSFARQTGMSCSECHTVFPELTPEGRAFKLGGYVQSTSSKPEFFVPVAAMVQLSYTGAKGLTNGIAPFDSDPNNATDKTILPQQFSLFYGGKIYDHIGALVQVTYDGSANAIALDNTDIRYANSTTLGGRDLVYGLTLNNNPTVSDVYNTTPAWGFPYASSSVALTPAASTIIDGALGQQVGGIGAYVFWNNLLYMEGAVYRTTLNGITRPLGAGSTPPGMVVHGAAPYWRVALQQQWKEQSISVGTYGIVADIFPGGGSSGPTDRFTDTALDAQYQYISKKHIVSLQTTYIHEKQNWNASYALGNTANPSDSLNTFRTNLNYYYRSNFGDIGGTVGYFSTTGDTDAVLYAPSQYTGSGSGSPNSNGFMLEADYLPWKTAKFSLQYTFYNKFNGARTDYDGSGTNASHNNTLYLVAWLMF